MIRWPLRCVCAVLLAAACDAGPTPSGGDMAVPGQQVGLVRVSTTSQMVAGLHFAQLYAGAAFFATGASALGCQVQTVGGCSVYHCGGAGADGGTALLPNAGLLTIGTGAQGITLLPGSEGGYSPFSRTDSAVFAGGQTISVVAMGGTVPSFQDQVSLPSGTFTLTAPQVSALLTVVIDRTVDLPMSFTAPAGPVLLEITQGVSTDHGTYVECLFDGAAGKGTVPRGALLGLDTGQAADPVALLIGPVAVRSDRAGPWEVQVAAIGGGSTARIFFR